MESIEKSIITLLSDKKMRTSIEIIKELGLGKKYDSVIIEILHKLVDNYDVYCSKKGKYMLFCDSEKSQKLVKGKFLDTSNDYGFVENDQDKEDIFVHGSNSNGAIDGDIVLVEIIKGKRDDKKCEGRIIKILKHELRSKVGEVYHYDGKLMVSLDDKKIKKLITLKGNEKDLSRLVDGDKVMVEFSNSKRDKEYISANFVKRIGHINDPDIDIVSIISDCGFDLEFNEEVINQLRNIPTKVSINELKGRRDLRDDNIFTIDGDDTKDIDDAISIKILSNGNYELGVHIADVSYYVKENSPLDLEARNRGTSVYLTDRVVPMLPHQLSNGICSLNPGVDRLTTSCVMEINKNGNVVNYDIFESVINSKLQMTYKKVNDYLEKGIINSGYEPFTKDLSIMHDLAKIVRKNKINRGFIDFDTDEIKIIVDKKGVPIEIIKRERGTGEELIEDFMILANETVATHLYNMNLPSVYRVHGMPDEKRLRRFINILGGLGITFKMDLKKITPLTIQRIIDELKKYPQFKVLSVLMLSCMDKAIYDTNNIGHFGIASSCYTHFTSPIRRYPDTTIHRLLKNYCFNNNLTEENIKHFEEILPEICAHASERERAAIECEREVDEFKEAEYMESHIGEEFIGMISGITSFGMFVMLDNLIEGLVPILDMEEYHIYDDTTETLINQKTKERYHLGDKLLVMVSRASKREHKIDFKIIRRMDVNEEKSQSEEKNS